MTRLRAASPWILAAVLVLAGVNHFWHRAAYESLIPGFLGSPRFWVWSSGVAEIACGLLVAVPQTRRLGGWAAFVLFLVVFPGNLTSAVHAHTAGGRWVSYLRLPLQIPLVLWAWQVARDAEPDRTSA